MAVEHYVTVVTPESGVEEQDKITHIVEVVRRHTEPEEINKSAQVIEVARMGGTLVNVGAGPQLPENPYEGQVWILT